MQHKLSLDKLFGALGQRLLTRRLKLLQHDMPLQYISLHAYKRSVAKIYKSWCALPESKQLAWIAFTLPMDPEFIATSRAKHMDDVSRQFPPDCQFAKFCRELVCRKNADAMQLFPSVLK